MQYFPRILLFLHNVSLALKNSSLFMHNIDGVLIVETIGFWSYSFSMLVLQRIYFSILCHQGAKRQKIILAGKWIDSGFYKSTAHEDAKQHFSAMHEQLILLFAECITFQLFFYDLLEVFEIYSTWRRETTFLNWFHFISKQAICFLHKQNNPFDFFIIKTSHRTSS